MNAKLKLLIAFFSVATAYGAADPVQIPEKMTQVIQALEGRNIRDFCEQFTKQELKLPNLHNTYWPRSALVLEGFQGNSYASIELAGNPELKGEHPLSLDTLAFAVCITTGSTKIALYPPQINFNFEFTTTVPCIKAYLVLAENADIVNTILGIDTTRKIFISTPPKDADMPTDKPEKKKSFMSRFSAKKKKH